MSKLHVTKSEEHLLMSIQPHEIDSDVQGPNGSVFDKEIYGLKYPEIFSQIEKSVPDSSLKYVFQNNPESFADDLSKPGGCQNYLNFLKELFIQGSSFTNDEFPWDVFYYTRALFHEHYDNMEDAVQDYVYARLCSPFEQWFYDQEASLLIKMDRQEDALNTFDDLLLWAETPEERQDAYDIIYRLIPRTPENTKRYQFSQDG